MFTGLSASFNVYGKSFMKLQSVYLSGVPVANTTLHNPFSAVPKLSARYPEFTAYKLLSSEYTTNFDNTITIVVPTPIQAGYIDVIAQNQAGYGTLTQYVIKDTYPGLLTQQQLRPWSSGVQVISADANITPEIENQILSITGDDLVTISGDNIISI
jgi:hypothetical protein